MNARLSRKPEAGAPRPLTALRNTLQEGSRYLLASAFALALDAGMYMALIRLAGVHYLIAAPCGFALGVAMIYMLSTRWVFRKRRLASVRSEFLIFTLIGLAGLLVNQLVIYVCVDKLSMSYELAKLASAAIVFGFNFVGRKLVLFTRF